MCSRGKIKIQGAHQGAPGPTLPRPMRTHWTARRPTRQPPHLISASSYCVIWLEAKLNGIVIMRDAHWMEGHKYTHGHANHHRIPHHPASASDFRATLAQLDPSTTSCTLQARTVGKLPRVWEELSSRTMSVASQVGENKNYARRL